MNNFIKVQFLSNVKNHLVARVIVANIKKHYEVIFLPEPGNNLRDSMLINPDTEKHFIINDDGVAIIPFSSKINPNIDRLVISKSVKEFITK